MKEKYESSFELTIIPPYPIEVPPILLKYPTPSPPGVPKLLISYCYGNDEALYLQTVHPS